MQWYAPQILSSLFKEVGDNVKIDTSVEFINPHNISLGSNIRIDHGCLLLATQEIKIGDQVHLAPGCYLMASGGKIELDNFCGLSARVSIFTATDDYTQGYLTNPTIPEEYKKVCRGDVILEKHVIVGSGSVIMPGCILEWGSAIGALSFVNKDIPRGMVVSGNPVRKICYRDQSKLQEREYAFYENTK